MRFGQSTRILLGLGALLLAVVLIGGADFLAQGILAPEQPLSTRMAPEQLLALEGPPEVVLEFSWGDGPSDINGWVLAVFESGSRLFVADVDPVQKSPRVRWFDEAGRVAGSHGCPPGSLNFSPLPGGFGYTVSKGVEGESMLAAVVDIETSAVETYTVPMKLNGGHLLQVDDTLYTQAANSEFSLESSIVTIVSKLVPVARGGVQVEDAEVPDAALDGYIIGRDGRVYDVVSETRVTESKQIEMSVVQVETGSTLTLPAGGDFLGVDEAGRAYVLMTDFPADEALDVPGIHAAAPTASLLLIADVGGAGQWVLPVWSNRYAATPRDAFHLSGDGLLAVRSTPATVTVMRYRGDFR